MRKPACKSDQHNYSSSCYILNFKLVATVMILSFWTEEQSDQGLHCLLFHLRLFDEILYGVASLFEF